MLTAWKQWFGRCLFIDAWAKTVITIFEVLKRRCNMITPTQYLFLLLRNKLCMLSKCIRLILVKLQGYSET